MANPDVSENVFFFSYWNPRRFFRHTIMNHQASETKRKPKFWDTWELHIRKWIQLFIPLLHSMFYYHYLLVFISLEFIFSHVIISICTVSCLPGERRRRRRRSRGREDFRRIVAALLVVGLLGNAMKLDGHAAGDADRRRVRVISCVIPCQPLISLDPWWKRVKNATNHICYVSIVPYIKSHKW